MWCVVLRLLRQIDGNVYPNLRWNVIHLPKRCMVQGAEAEPFFKRFKSVQKRLLSHHAAHPVEW